MPAGRSARLLPAHEDGLARDGQLVGRPVKVVFVNRFFHPDPAPTGLYATDVAFDWAADGNEVHAIAGRRGYNDPKRRYAPEETLRGVHIHRVWTSRWGRR